MVLLINVCKEKLHYYEFVKPIEDILGKNNLRFFTRHYKKISKEDLENADKIIICGTSLKDNEFLEDIKKYSYKKFPRNKWRKGRLSFASILRLTGNLSQRKHLHILVSSRSQKQGDY